MASLPYPRNIAGRISTENDGGVPGITSTEAMNLFNASVERQ